MAPRSPSDNPPPLTTGESVSGEQTGDETRERIIRLAFGGDRARFDHFLRTIRESVPPDVAVILRGSVVTGKRWEDGAPFDADGPGSSDLDLTLIGGGMVKHFDVFYIPGLHSAPLSDAHPDASLTFIPLRQALMRIAQRPVNIQATADMVQYASDIVMNQPYYTLIPKADDAGS